MISISGCNSIVIVLISNYILFKVYHSMYLKYLPKRTHFGYDVMVHASMLAALDHNNNVNKEQVSVIIPSHCTVFCTM